MKNRIGIFGALAALVCLMLVSPATAGGPRPNVVLGSDIVVTDLNEDGIGSGTLNDLFPALFDFNKKKIKGTRIPNPNGKGFLYGYGLGIDSAAGMLANVSMTKNGPTMPVVIRGARMENCNFIPASLNVATINLQGIVSGTVFDSFRKSSYPVRYYPNGEYNVWPEGFPNAVAIDCANNGDMLVQILPIYGDNDELLQEASIGIWSINDQFTYVGKGYGQAISPNGRFVVAQENGTGVRFDRKSGSLTPSLTTLLPIEFENDYDQWTNPLDVNNDGVVVGVSKGRAARWNNTQVTSGTTQSAFPVSQVVNVEVGENLNDLTTLPKGFVATSAYKVTGSGAILMTAQRSITRTRMDYRTIYLPKVDGPVIRPL